MAVYSFRCGSCGNSEDKNRAFGQTDCPVCRCGTVMVRDYKTELQSQSHFIPLHMSSKNTTSRSDFLPDNKFWESPADPTGERGMAKWKQEHRLKGKEELI